MTERVEKTDAEWQTELDPDRYQVLRCGATEAPWSGELNLVHDEGVFRCGACGAELFRSDTKFDSGSGWPSFFAPLAEDAVETEEDLTHGMRRTEVRCAVRLSPRPRLPRRPRADRAFATASTRSRSTSSLTTASPPGAAAPGSRRRGRDRFQAEVAVVPHDDPPGDVEPEARPSPGSFVVKNASKTRSAISGGTPAPSSSTSTLMKSPERDVRIVTRSVRAQRARCR